MLKSFFDVFNEQLRINFNLRNKLVKDTQVHSREYRSAAKMQNNVREFLATLSKLAHCEVHDLNEAKQIISDALSRDNSLTSIRGQIQELEKKSNDLDRQLQSKHAELESLQSKTDTETSEILQKSRKTQDRVEDLRRQLRDIEPDVRQKRERLEQKKSRRTELVKQVRERKEAIEETRRSFEGRQKERKGLRRELKKAISVLHAKRQQLISDQEPLMRALEEAQSELETAKKMTKKELDSLAQQRADIELDIQTIQTKINDRVQEKTSLLAELRSLQEQTTQAKEFADDLTKEASACRKAIGIIDRETKEFLTDAETPEEQLAAFATTAEEIAQTITDVKAEIEDLKKENGKLKSKIRVNQEKIASVRKANKKIKCSVRVQTEELDEVKADLEKHRKRHALYRSTLREYEQLRQELGLKSSATPRQVAERAIAFVKESTEREKQRRAAMRCSRSSVSSDLEVLCEQLGKLESRIIC